jgi:hypothetical protein
MPNVQKIVVEIDPNGRASSTSGVDEQSITTSNTVREQNVTVGGLVNLGLIIESGKNIANTFFGQAGEMTGSSRFQDNIDAIGTGIGYLGAFWFNPILGSAVITTSAISSAVKASVTAKNDNIEASYNRGVLGNAYNNGRIVGGN